MKNDSVEQILADSDKAELLEDFAKDMETAGKVQSSLARVPKEVYNASNK